MDDPGTTNEQLVAQLRQRIAELEASESRQRTEAASRASETSAREERHRQRQKMEAVGRLAGDVVHDFNNLLTAILGYCDLLLADLSPDDRHREDVAEIQKAGTTAVRLTRQLLALGRKPIDEPRAAGKEFADAPPLVNRPHAGAETVLVMESAEGLRELTRKLLQRQGYTVLVAATADEALRLFEQNVTIDVLLTDVVMSGAGGQELTKQLVKQRPALRVIYMSGYIEDAGVQLRGLESEIAVLAKPFTAEALGRKVREVLDR